MGPIRACGALTIINSAVRERGGVRRGQKERREAGGRGKGVQ